MLKYFEGNNRATELRRVAVKLVAATEAMRSWPAGGSAAYVPQGVASLQAMKAG